MGPDSQVIMDQGLILMLVLSVIEVPSIQHHVAGGVLDALEVAGA